MVPPTESGIRHWHGSTIGYSTLTWLQQRHSWSRLSLLCQGARHPFAQAVGRNIANPTAMLLSAANMLKHLKWVSLLVLVVRNTSHFIPYLLILVHCNRQALESTLKCLFVYMLTYVQDGSSHFLIVTVLCCSLEYHSQMVSDAVKRVIKQGKVSVCVDCYSTYCAVLWGRLP